MADDQYRNRLGRGLAALLSDASAESPETNAPSGARQIAIELVRPNPNNPRRVFDENDLSELTESIREKGILQPILVRALAGVTDAFEIIAGERRWRAAQRAGLHDVPVLIVAATDSEALEFAIIENVQRADLNALEEARGYDRLIQHFTYTQADVAKVVGKSRSHIANTLRLMNLPDSVKEKLQSGLLSAGHARALLGMTDPDKIADRIVAQGLSVRDVERIGQDTAPEHKSGAARPDKDADTKMLEKALMNVLGLKVVIDHRRAGGTLSIRYTTLEQLENVCLRLQR